MSSPIAQPDIVSCLAVDPDGNIYVAEVKESQNNQTYLQKFPPSGKNPVLIATLGYGAYIAEHMTVDDKGNVYFLGSELQGHQYLKVLHPDGSIKTLIAQSSYHSIIYSDGYLYACATSGGELDRISLDGKVSRFDKGGLTQAGNMGVGPNGVLYVTNIAFEHRRVQMIDTNGTVSTFYESTKDPDWNDVWGIAVTNSGDVYVSAKDSQTLFKLTVIKNTVHAKKLFSGFGTYVALAAAHRSTPYWRTPSGSVLIVGVVIAGVLVLWRRRDAGKRDAGMREK